MLTYLILGLWSCTSNKSIDTGIPVVEEESEETGDTDETDTDTVETDETDETDTEIVDTGDPEETGDTEETGDPDSGDPLEPTEHSVFDFAYPDANVSSSTFGQPVSPRDYMQQVSGWYFIKAT